MQKQPLYYDKMTALIGHYDMQAYCVLCNRYVDMPPKYVLRRYASIDVPTLERRLRCRQCPRKFALLFLPYPIDWSQCPRPNNVIPFPGVDKLTVV
jgi:hypothetical protein